MTARKYINQYKVEVTEKEAVTSDEIAVEKLFKSKEAQAAFNYVAKFDPRWSMKTPDYEGDFCYLSAGINIKRGKGSDVSYPVVNSPTAKTFDELVIKTRDNLKKALTEGEVDGMKTGPMNVIVVSSPDGDRKIFKKNAKGYLVSSKQRFKI